MPNNKCTLSEIDQICSRAHCEKSNDRIYSTPVPNKILWISASFKLWYLIVAQLLLEIDKNKTVPLLNKHTLCKVHTFHRFHVGNRLFYFLIRYKKTQQKSKINFPQFLRCMYVCMFVSSVQVTPFDVWSWKFYHDICQHSSRCTDNHFVVILKFGGVMPLFRHFRKNTFS